MILPLPPSLWPNWKLPLWANCASTYLPVSDGGGGPNCCIQPRGRGYVMPKYWSVKTLLVTVPPSGSGVAVSLALDHAPLTRIVSLGTIPSGLGWVMVEKSPPFLEGVACSGGF